MSNAVLEASKRSDGSGDRVRWPAHARTLGAPNAAPNHRAIRMTQMQFDRGDVQTSLDVAARRLHE